MTDYQNVMELLVEREYQNIAPTLNCCACACCRADVIAYALNHLPTKYVALRPGKAYAKQVILQKQYRTAIISALVQAAGVVREHPRHPGGAG